MNAATTQCESQYQLQETLQTSVGYVVPCDDWSDQPGSSMEADTGSGFEGNEIACSFADFDFNFSSIVFSEEEPGRFSSCYMSPADELFHDGKIRPLQPIALFQPMSISEETALIAQIQALEDPAFQPRRPSHVCGSVSAPASPVNPSSKLEMYWSPEREVIEPARPHSPKHEKERRKGEFVRDRDQPAAICNRPIARDRASSIHVVYRRCRSASSSSQVFQVDHDCPDTATRRKVSEIIDVHALAHREASENQPSKSSTTGRPHKKRTLKELLQREEQRKQIMNNLDIGPRSVASFLNEEIGKKQGRSTLHATMSELVLPEQWRWSNVRPGSTWARSPKALSPHERHYAAQRAYADKMRKKTFLPYRQGLLGCLGFNSGPAAASFRSSNNSHLSNHNRPHPPVVY